MTALRRVMTVLCCVLASSSLSSAAASAAADAPRIQRMDVRLVDDDTRRFGPPLAATGLLPGGDSGVAVLVVEHSVADVADVEVSMHDVRGAENGCGRPELFFDPECDSDGPGQLADQLLVTMQLADLESNGDCVVRPDSPVVGELDAVRFADLPVAMPGAVDAEEEPRAVLRMARDERRCVALSWWLPDRVDNNVVMGDSLQFALSVAARQVEETEVLSDSVDRPPATTVVSAAAPTRRFAGPAALPRTGSDGLVFALVTALATLLVGLVLLAVARRLGRAVR